MSAFQALKNFGNNYFMDTPAEKTEGIRRNSTGRVIIASLVGTAIEFYDFYIYATATALVLGSLFFPGESDSVKQISAFATFSIAFLARPIGSALFGHFGDKIGRKSTLVASLLVMGISTVLIGCLPTYASIGIWAPIILCLLRFGQGIGFGGEWGGAALLAVENAPEGKRGWFGMFPQLGAPIGFITANGIFLLLTILLSDEQFLAWGWRIPFILSITLIYIGLYVRLKIVESYAFDKTVKNDEVVKYPIITTIKDYPIQTLLGTFSMVACYGLFYISTVFALSYGTKTLGFTKTTFLTTQCVAIVAMIFATMIAGYLSDKIGRRPVLLSGIIVTALLGLIIGPAMESHNIFYIGLFLTAAFFIMGIIFGPMGALLPEIFPTKVRYTGASVTYNIGGIIGASFAPLIAQKLVDYGGIRYVGLYLLTAAVMSFLAIWFIKETKSSDIVRM